MDSYNVVFLQSAVDDLEEIVLYIAADNVNAAMRVHDAIVEYATKLSSFPKLEPLVPDEKISRYGFRYLTLENYLIFYKINKADIHIHRVLHSSRNYRDIFSFPDEKSLPH